MVYVRAHQAGVAAPGDIFGDGLREAYKAGHCTIALRDTVEVHRRAARSYAAEYGTCVVVRTVAEEMVRMDSHHPENYDWALARLLERVPTAERGLAEGTVERVAMRLGTGAYANANATFEEYRRRFDVICGKPSLKRRLYLAIRVAFLDGEAPRSTREVHHGKMLIKQELAKVRRGNGAPGVRGVYAMDTMETVIGVSDTAFVEAMLRKTPGVSPRVPERYKLTSWAAHIEDSGIAAEQCIVLGIDGEAFERHQSRQRQRDAAATLRILHPTLADEYSWRLEPRETRLTCDVATVVVPREAAVMASGRDATMCLGTITNFQVIDSVFHDMGLEPVKDYFAACSIDDNITVLCSEASMAVAPGEVFGAARALGMSYSEECYQVGLVGAKYLGCVVAQVAEGIVMIPDLARAWARAGTYMVHVAVDAGRRAVDEECMACLLGHVAGFTYRHRRMPITATLGRYLAAFAADAQQRIGRRVKKKAPRDEWKEEFAVADLPAVTVPEVVGLDERLSYLHAWGVSDDLATRIEQEIDAARVAKQWYLDLTRFEAELKAEMADAAARRRSQAECKQRAYAAMAAGSEADEEEGPRERFLGEGAAPDPP